MSSKLFIEKLPVDWCGFGSLTARAGNISKGSEVPQLLNTIQNIVRVRDESVLYYRLIKELVACSYKLIMTYYGGGLTLKSGALNSPFRKHVTLRYGPPREEVRWGIRLSQIKKINNFYFSLKSFLGWISLCRRCPFLDNQEGHWRYWWSQGRPHVVRVTRASRGPPPVSVTLRGEESHQVVVVVVVVAPMLLVAHTATTSHADCSLSIITIAAKTQDTFAALIFYIFKRLI